MENRTRGSLGALCGAAGMLLASWMMGTNAYAEEGVLTPPPAEPSRTAVAEPTQDQPRYMAHVLGGHLFSPILSIPAPFIDTQTSMTLLGAYGSYPAANLGFNLNGDDLKLGGFEAALGVQYAPTHWFALSVGFAGNMLTGMNSESALAYGASVVRQWNFGGLVKLVECERSILSLGLIVQLPHYVSVSPTDIFAAINRTVTAGSPNFAPENVSSAWVPSLRYAYAIDPTLGVNVNAGFRAYSLEHSNPDQSTIQLNLALGLSADFNPRTGVPIEFTANFVRHQLVQSTDINSNLFSFGFYESQWKQVSFGAEIGFANVSGNDSTVVALNTRVYY